MTLNSFLLVILILLPLMLFAFYKGNKLSKSPIPYFIIIVLAMGLSYWTFTHYAKSRGGYYKNTEYHLLQYDGFKFSEGTLKLASDKAPDKAILDTELGELELDATARLSSTGFKLPIYLEDTPDSKRFHVANIVNELSLESGDELIVIDGTKQLLKIKYMEVGEKEKIEGYCFKFSVNDTISDSKSFSAFRKGYPLVDLLQEGARTRVDSETRDKLANCYVLRDSYVLDETNPQNESDKVFLFGFDRLPTSMTLYKNGKQITKDLNGDIKGAEMKDRRFFYGLPNSNRQVYLVESDGDSISVTHRLPKRYHFPDDIRLGENKILLTTDKQDIIDRHDDSISFYQFVEQLDKNSIYKATAMIDFIMDSAGVKIKAQYGDMNDEVAKSDLIPITVDKQFELRTLSCRMNNVGTDNFARVSYLFKIRDMRKNVVYNKAPKLYIVMLIMLLAIYLMLYFMNQDKKSRINKLYILETSVYLTLIAFLTVRLVMLWRLYTFPPVEDISRMQWDKLTNPQNYNSTFWGIVLVLGIRIVILFIQTLLWKRTSLNVNDLLNNAFDWMEEGITIRGKYYDISRKWIVAFLLPILTYAICIPFSSQSSKIGIVIKEAIVPLLAFAINSIFYVYRIRKEDDRGEYNRRGVFSWLAIAWNMVLLMGLMYMYKGFNEHGMILPLIGVFSLWLLIVFLVTPSSTKWFKWVALAACGLGLIVVFGHVPLVQTSLGRKVLSQTPPKLSRAKERLVATFQTPTEMMQNQDVEFKGKSMQDILNASSNKWFIDNHLVQRDYLETVKYKKGFVLDKEFNKQAVNYTIQTRDVVLLRYLFYEHGIGVAKKLLCILIVLTINVFAVFKRKNNNLPFLQQLPMQASVFLMVFSAYLFLVNMNAVVFVGLDFPFLTLTSKAAPFGLLLLLLAILLPVNIKHQEDSLVNDSSTQGPDWGKALVGVVAVALMAVIVALPSRRIEKQVQNDKGTMLSSFSVSMAPLDEFINDYMNPLLRDYQDKNPHLQKMAITDPKLKKELNDFVFGADKVMDNALMNFAKKTKQENSIAFINSAFQKLFNTSLTNTMNIIHIKKQRDGRLCFVPNKVYYDLKPLFDNDALLKWHGDLMGAAGVSRLTFVGEHHKEALTLEKGFKEYGNINNDAKNYENLKSQFLGVISNIDPRISFNIVQIPKEYCYEPEVGNRDVYIINPTDSPIGKEYVVYPNGDATNPIKKKSVALWVKPNDIVKVTGASQSFSFRTESGRYFSKRIHFNGKYQPVYPLEGRFIFAYNFDQMLARSYHPTGSSEQPVRISLDYDLLNEVYDYCESKMAIGKSDIFGEGVTVTAIDGNGRIRLLADYNPKASKTIDPNKTMKMRQKMDEFYLSGNKTGQDALLQNRNVSGMPIGPGSTIKVPIYVATSSGSNLDWTKIKVLFHPKTVRFDDGAIVERFGNYKTDGIHHKGGWDELSSEYKTNSEMDASRFITTSNNFFFGSLIALSTYSPTRLESGLKGVLAQSNANEAVFPKFVMDGSCYKFKNDFLDEIGGSRTLEKGLTDNFHFLTLLNRDEGNQPYDITPVDFLYEGDTTQTLSTRMRSMNSEYVYSERPKLYRDLANMIEEDKIKSIFHLTSGGSKYLDVTPLNMAEMYLRVAQLNAAESILTYDDAADSIPYKPFVFIDDNFVSQMKSTTFFGMWNVIEDRNDNGIVASGAKGEGTLGNDTDKGVQNKYKEMKYPIYVYGKTGTVGDPSQQTHDNRHYAFILSNKRLDQTTNRDGLKVYVVYFGYYDSSFERHSETAQTRKDILQKIIESETFKNYWEEGSSKTTH